MADLKVMYSSKSDEWATPQNFFDELNREFDFNLDPCATEENHKCETYFTRENDGLSQNWGVAGCFAILHIQRFQNGLRKHFMRLRKRIHWSSCLCQAERIQGIFTTS